MNAGFDQQKHDELRKRKLEYEQYKTNNPIIINNSRAVDQYYANHRNALKPFQRLSVPPGSPITFAQAPAAQLGQSIQQNRQAQSP